MGGNGSRVTGKAARVVRLDAEQDQVQREAILGQIPCGQPTIQGSATPLNPSEQRKNGLFDRNCKVWTYPVEPAKVFFTYICRVN